jgi:hypothetical protein
LQSGHISIVYQIMNGGLPDLILTTAPMSTSGVQTLLDHFIGSRQQPRG